MFQTLKQKVIFFVRVTLNYRFYRAFRFRRVARRHYSHYYSKTASHAHNEKPWVICIFDGRGGYQHGLADRLRGCMTTYKFCRDHNIDFRIYFINPFHLEYFLEPTKYDWRIADSDISFNKEDSRPVFIDSSSVDVMTDLKFQRKIMCKFILHDIHRYKQVHLHTNVWYEQPLFGELFHELFRPVPKLKAAIDEQVRNLDNGNFIAISSRFMEALGDFRENKNRDAIGLSVEEQQQLIERCLEKIDEIHKMNPDSKKVLVTSDSEKFISAARSRFNYVYTIPGRIGHIDIIDGSAENMDIHFKTFVDYFVLSNARKVFLIATGPMYRGSGFAQQAAQIGHRPFERILF